MNHYCTYFDRGFVIQGLALWRSLSRWNPNATLWVLALDDVTEELLTGLGEPQLHVVPLRELERDDAALLSAKANRSRIEYFFTLSPCWPRWLLRAHPEIGRILYLDADLFCFGDPDRIGRAMDGAGASVLITPHGFPPWLRHYEQHGRFNVGVLGFRNDAGGNACLDDWRQRCLDWCFDRVEPDRYADQKYLDAWPDRFGPSVLVLDDPGLTLAPWNWSMHRLHAATEQQALCYIDESPLTIFHFARFRPLQGDTWWQSGQLDYGVMPQAWRDTLYTPYWRALRSARQELQRLRPEIDFPRRGSRLNRTWLRSLPLRAAFGGDWLRVGDRFFNLRFGVGRWSGRALAAARRVARGRRL